MKIMTFNTQHCQNFLTRKIDYEIMANTIKDCDADIVGLNEIRGEGPMPDFDAQTEILSELTQMQHKFFAKAINIDGKNPYGNAILSKVAIKTAEVIAIPDPEPKIEGQFYESRCILKAVMENGLTVLITHFGLNRDEQVSAVETVLKTIADERCILMGDFNVCPDDEILIPIREKMRDTADSFDGPRLSFVSDVPDKKIDYIFVSRDIEVLSADIPAIIASDHRPHIAEILMDL